GDVAPLGGPPDQSIHGGDVVVLLRGLGDEDIDGDGVPASIEIEYGASPFRYDTDGDGLSDAQELALGTDPASADTDEDGIPDGQEVANGTSPTSGIHFRYTDHAG